MRPPLRTATALAAALLLAAGSLTVTPSPASAAAASYIRLNQVGYQADQEKIAYLMGTTAQSAAAFSVVSSAGATVRSGRVGTSRGSWNSAYNAVLPIDFTDVTTPGTYTIQISGVGTSAAFEIGSRADLYAPVSRAMSTFFQTQRDGANVIPGALNRQPSHPDDVSATVYNVPTFQDGSDVIVGNLSAISNTPKVDVSGGWFDAGDYLKFTHTTAYAVGALQVAERSGSTDPARAAEIEHAMAWLDKMWDETDNVLYVQVGLGGGNSAGTFAGDHGDWRLPEADSTITDRAGTGKYYLRYRPVLRANAPGAQISPNLAGRVSAAFALSAQRHAASDPARAASDLAKAAAIYGKAQISNPPSKLVTAYPFAFYPETVWRDDIVYAATELARAGRALGDSRAQGWLNQAALHAKNYIEEGGSTLNLYDVGGIALPDLAEELTATGTTGFAVTPESIRQHQQARLDEAVARANADRFRAGAEYANYDSTSYTLGLIAQATRYDEVFGTSTYRAFAQSQANWALGGNPWGVSLIVGVGDTFPKCPHHQVADLSGTGAILTGAAVNGPNGEDEFEGLETSESCPVDGVDQYAAFSGNGARYLDDTEAWMSNEPAIDFTATGLLAFALLGKGTGGGTDPDPDPDPQPEVKKDTVAVFRAAEHRVFIRNSLTTGPADAYVTVGVAGDVGFTGDWDGDGVDGIGFWNPSTRTVYLRNSFTGDGPADHKFVASFATASDVPLVGDWDGNGTDTFATWRPGDRTVRIRNTHDGGATQVGVPFGASTDTILVGDWDGDGQDSLGYYRPGERRFALRDQLEGTAAPETQFVYGGNGDKPVVGDWNGDGKDTAGVFRSPNSWFLKNSNAPGNADYAEFTFGQTGDKPMAGDWVRDGAPPPAGQTPGQIAAAKGFYTDPDSNPLKWVAENPGDARMPAIRDNLATKAGARWFGDWSGDVRAATDAYVDGASAAGKVPILVAYNIPKRDCDGQSAGGAASAAAYRTWITEFAAGVAGRPAIVVLEPDAVTQVDCLSAAQMTERFGLVTHAVDAFGGQTWTYIDAGNAGWIAAETIAERLGRSGIANAHGFAVNTSNFWPTADSTTYANDINANLGSAKPFVIDTSRNGNGHKDDWCNPDGVKLGETSRVNTSGGAEMLLWLKVPGDSDGPDCGRIRNLPAGTFSPDYAMWLISGS
ncbi:endoglucanase [Catenuloplanes nepalensis]|uniref:Glucanase n=1 Tax=Catenuloplanes nepalensis TaxID=587533 RepID=A0ABT9MN52_9ACTN|nr:glycoside hydrolase family 9 protein [Catenuloplanes nepalensis]MDP9792823.1 endoglucanase [Catenuloplanes nepalensis]